MAIRRVGTTGVAIVAAALSGAVSGASGQEPATPAPVRVTVGGHEVDLGRDLHAQAVAIGRTFLRERVTLLTPEEPVERSRHALGARFDVARLERLLREAADPGSAMRRLHAQQFAGRPLELPMPVSVDGDVLFDLLLQLKDDLDRRAEDARVDTETRLLRPHRDGLEVDVWATLEAIERAHRTGASRVELVAERTPARRTVEDLHEVRMDAVLGTFETRYDSTAKAKDRTFNLKVAASRIDGLVLMPGEVFDFNEIVGERSEANGFRVAPVIAAGELVDGIGGGTCQISGTLHGAVFFAGLPILERHPHSRPSFYIKLGLDAAVSYPNLNFRFRNDRDFPVVIGFRVEGGIARATLWGAEHGDMVSFVRRIDETMPFEEREVEDPSLPSGVRVLSQRGIPGFRVSRWRVIRDLETNQAVRERMEDVYPPTTQIWRVGTGGPAPEGYEPPPDDDHPEYTADAYLEMTQGAGIEGTQEVRRAGRTGTPGWTVRAGYTDGI